MFFFFTTEFEQQSVRLVLSVTPGSYERPKGMSLFYITRTCFYVSGNTKCQYVFDHTLKRVYMTCNDCVRLHCLFVCGQESGEKAGKTKTRDGVKKDTEGEPFIRVTGLMNFSV